VTPRILRGAKECQYLTGRRTFCDAPTAGGTSYCAEHAKLCFQNWSDAA
jgi:hypothetical protein